MGENKTENIESSIDAFRAIKSFVYQKGAYPRNFDTGFWEDKDFEDPGFRPSIRADFDEYLEMLAFVNNKHAKTLYDAVPNIESEYNYLVINSRNMEQAVKLFKKKFEEVIFAIEWEMDINKTLKNYLVPLQSHKIITDEEGSVYQDLICNIGMIHCQSVNVVCKIFELARPWDKNRPDIPKAEAPQTGSAEKPKSEIEYEQPLQSEDKQPSQATPPKTEGEERRQIPKEFADYFNAPFKGIGPNTIDYYSKLVSSLTDAARERKGYEYAKIALLIYRSSKLLQRKKPNTFREWYKYFCKAVGCEYNKDYKPSNLPISKRLKDEFYYLLD